jgi:hypothetical protein
MTLELQIGGRELRFLRDFAPPNELRLRLPTSSTLLLVIPFRSRLTSRRCPVPSLPFPVFVPLLRPLLLLLFRLVHYYHYCYNCSSCCYLVHVLLYYLHRYFLVLLLRRPVPVCVLPCVPSVARV